MNIGDNATPQAGPANVVDLDDNQTPMAGNTGSGSGTTALPDGEIPAAGISPIAIGGIALLAVIAAIAAIAFALARRRKGEEEEEESAYKKPLEQV